MLILEGPDNSGKTTLASAFREVLGWRHQCSEGPPQGIEDINDRVRRYLDAERDVIYDRHPAISQNIYCVIRSNPQRVRDDLVAELYARDPVIIYCEPLDRGLEGHVTKGHDSAAHLDGIAENHQRILEAYRSWALQHAHFLYRIGDNVPALMSAVLSYRRERTRQKSETA
jgi:hypothetical protein